MTGAAAPTATETTPGGSRTARCEAGSAAPARRRGGPLTADPADGVARVVLAGLFLALSYRIGLDVIETGRATGLLLLTSELLVVVLTLARRSAIEIDRRWKVRLIALASIAGPIMVRPSAAAGLVIEPYTLAVSAVGLAIVAAGKLSLGRSFGLLPANRGIVCAGVYRVVRHPIYLGYVITNGRFWRPTPPRGTCARWSRPTWVCSRGPASRSGRSRATPRIAAIGMSCRGGWCRGFTDQLRRVARCLATKLRIRSASRSTRSWNSIPIPRPFRPSRTVAQQMISSKAGGSFRRTITRLPSG